jgi:ribose/xylose/arabinose/galactoside ABC-type transport system permease subunit
MYITQYLGVVILQIINNILNFIKINPIINVWTTKDNFS